MLNPNAPIPLYRQLSDRLAAKIRAGQYPIGSRIPSEPKLAADYGIGRPTVRQALDVLVRKGLLVRKRGSGTYVGEPSREVDLFSLDGTTAAFEKKGIAVQARILMPMTLRTVCDPEDHPFARRQAFCFQRLTSVNQAPVLIEDLFLDPMLFPDIDRIDLRGRSLSEVADTYFHLNPIGGRQSFRIGYLVDNEAGQKAFHLQVHSEMPLLVVSRWLDFPQMAQGVFSQMWCRTDRFVFSQTIGGSGYA